MCLWHYNTSERTYEKLCNSMKVYVFFYETDIAMLLRQRLTHEEIKILTKDLTSPLLNSA